EISQPPAIPVPTLIGPASRLAFASFVAEYLWRQRRRFDFVIVQGYSLGALAANVVGRIAGLPTIMMVCSPVEAYYRCRQAHPEQGKVFRRAELWAFQMLARLNAILGKRYIVLSHYLAEVVRSHGGRK